MDFLQLIIDQFGPLLAMLKDATPQAIVGVFIIFISVFVLRYVKVLPDSKYARIANIVFAALLSGVTSGASNQKEVALFAMTAAGASGLGHIVSELYEKYYKQPKAFSV